MVSQNYLPPIVVIDSLFQSNTFQLLKCQDVLFSFVIPHRKCREFVFWSVDRTKKGHLKTPLCAPAN